MPKIGFISDIHFKLHKRSNKFLPHIVKSIEKFEQLCEERAVDCIMIGGDLFHIKDVISIEAQNVALDSLRNIMRKFPTYVITGNHDVFTKKDNSVNNVKIFASDCFFYQDYGYKDFSDSRWHFLPFFPDEVYVDKMSTAQLHPTKKNYLLTHVGLRNFSVENGHEDVWSELSAEIFEDKFYRVFSGHYHSHQTRGSVTYISSPFESHFNDPGPHGFLFYDTTTDGIEFVQNELSPRFISVELTKQNLDFLKTIENSFIKLTISKHIDSQMLLKYKNRLLVKNFDVQFDFNMSSNSIKEIAIAKDWDDFVHESPEELLKSYVNNNNFGFESKELLEYII